MSVGIGDVRRIALSLPEVSERRSWEQPAWFHRRLVARMWDDDRLTVRVEDDGERIALATGEPEIFSTTDHHAGSSLVLVRLAAIEEPMLTDLLTQSWWNAAPNVLRRRYPPLGPPA